MATAAGLAPDGTPPSGERSAAVVEVDNRLRRALRVGNPWSAAEIVEAFGRRYPDALAKLQRERAGEPFAAGPVAPVVTPVERTVSATLGTEVAQALDDVRQDLQALTTDALLKDVAPELRGWSVAINTAVADGLAAARVGLDPRSRDRAFAMRRLLGDYARLARFVGALTPAANRQYRQLALSLDEVAGIILVMLGDSLANAGHGGSRFLLQVPASELSSRRDAVIHALRNLVGSTQEAYGPQEWPRGLVAYRDMVDRIERSGHGDLLALFNESHLAQILDDLAERAANPTSESLRSVGSTAPAALASVRRLLTIGGGVADPESPPLSAFFAALQLFLDAFDTTRSQSGSRLVFIARPPIMLYGLYGIGGPDPAAQRLIGLTIARGRLAEYVDCFLACSCECEQVAAQLALDKALYDVDRAIDLYALGTDPNPADPVDPERGGEPEWRAAAYGYVLDEVAALLQQLGTPVPAELTDPRNLLWWDRLRITLGDAPPSANDPNLSVRSNLGRTATVTGFVRQRFLTFPRAVLRVLDDADAALNTPTPNPRHVVAGPPRLFGRLRRIEMMREELCVQRANERHWRELVRAMAPTCLNQAGVLEATEAICARALSWVTRDGEDPCPELQGNIPPTIETSLDTIADNVVRTGANRPRFRKF
jgi:hypothetical protein